MWNYIFWLLIFCHTIEADPWSESNGGSREALRDEDKNPPSDTSMALGQISLIKTQIKPTKPLS